MEKWYLNNYVNRRDWLLENMHNYDLSSDEILLIMLIDYQNTYNNPITYAYLSAKMGKDQGEIDKLLAGLISKNYLKIVTRDRVSYDLTPLFDNEVENNTVANSDNLFEIFETEFGRPLSENDALKIDSFIKYYPYESIIKALQIASAKNKLNTAYVEGILKNNAK